METKLETLLNKLIALGRKPRGIKLEYLNSDISRGIKIFDGRVSIMYEMWGVLNTHKTFSINDICSIDSGLRQFVCGLDKNYLPFCSKCNIKLESNNDKMKGDVWYEEEVNFWLMLSSIQEDKENFLLQNIQLNGN